MNATFVKFVMGAALITSLSAGVALAEPHWDAAHPRRAEVTARAENLDRRISAERRDGELSRGQAHVLRAADTRILARERFDARRHDGHISRAEQMRLNRSENRISRHLDR